MIRIIVIVRESGRLKPDYSLTFDAPAIPREGEYISIQRPDKMRPLGEDMIVRKVWWRYFHPHAGAYQTEEDQKVGKLDEVYVECEPAIGPWSSDDWRKSFEGHAPTLEVERFSVREADLVRGVKQ
jgi:hypothetical protein